MNTRDKDREKKKGKENHCSVAEIPTAGTTTGATSAVAVTVKDRHENEHKVAEELVVPVSNGCITEKTTLSPKPPQIINSPPAFHLDTNLNYSNALDVPFVHGVNDAPVIILTGCSPLPSACPELNSLQPPKLLNPQQQMNNININNNSNNNGNLTASSSVKTLQVL
ncbi:uncharacterized protein LOC111713220 [Eurytemora carolleeae]|uniref:uncharacterized protein LOC111713220 n=1 Tax=Eurytemora carolleeae TaxID=1294199 RepID=UPI000C7678D8|nr:uncharacterized protein LOC111713220 [Eurytemora carolleeae]|eukprot:XP_023343812.1 uncharacterized protein LOC111713220 [Eurytemora affinis]